MANSVGFQKGNKAAVGSGGPKGRQNIVTSVLISQLNEINPKTHRAVVHEIVDQLVLQARGYKKEVLVKNKDGTSKIKKIDVVGDLLAIREIIDRVEGRAAQAVTISGDPEKPLVHKHESDVAFQDAIGTLDQVVRDKQASANGARKLDS